MNSDLELLVGPAVVVDDEIENNEASILSIVDGLEAANFPVLRKRRIPQDEEIRHWQAMSMIVLDWNFKASTSELNEPVPLGLAQPDATRRDPGRNPVPFVHKLMEELYCPIFVISDVDGDEIWQDLLHGRSEEEVRQLRARVMVRTKAEAEDRLLEILVEWISGHAAICALKEWDRGYEKAKTTLFRELQLTDVEWPGILWRTWQDDGADPNRALTDTICRNLLHRMGPSIFSPKTVSSVENPNLMDSVRRLLHHQAVLSNDNLPPDVVMTGDFFYETKDGAHFPQFVDICITPACNLIPRRGDVDDIKMFMLRASRVQDSELKSPEAIEGKMKSDNSITSALVHHLFPEDVMYIVYFKRWWTTKWGKVKHKRRGRLLDPYLTLLQQRNALYSQRQGLPSLPTDFYEPRDQSA